MNDRRQWSAWLVNASMFIYILWLMLPAVQVRLRAVTGALALAVFAAGVLLEWETFIEHWKSLLLRAACIAALPLALLFIMQRGGEERLGYYAQQVMFWFPLFWCAYAAQIPERIAYRARVYRNGVGFCR